MSQEQSSLTSYDDPESGATQFKCPICGFTDEKEWIVRSHINLSTDNPHHHREGFMPEDELDVLDADGNVLDSRQGNPRRRFETLQNLSTDDFPERLTDTEQQIIRIAVQNLTENYTEITERVNDARAEENLDSLDYSKVYRTVVDELGVKRKPKEKGKSTEEKGYQDLTQRQRAVINEYVKNPSQSAYQIAQEVGVHESYPPQILDKYAHIAESLTPDDIVPVTDLDATEFDFDPTEPTNEPMNQQILDATEEEYNQLTSLQQAVVDKLVENPNTSNAIIANETHADPMFVERVESEFDTLIRVRRGDAPLSELKGDTEPEPTADSSQDEEPETESTTSDTEKDDMSQDSTFITKGSTTTGTEIIDLSEHNAPETLIEKFESRTPKQQAVLTQLAKEPTPTEPETPDKTIGEKAGVHGTYVSQVIEKYGDIATAIRQHLTDGTVPDEFTDDETDVSADTEDEPTFEDRIEAAVEDEDITRLKVREILDNIEQVDDIDLLKRALDLDKDRKTSSRAFKNRIEELTEDKQELSWVETEPEPEETAEGDAELENIDESEVDAEPEPQDDSTPSQEVETPQPSMTETPKSAPQSQSITVEDIQQIDATAKQFIRTAESELENSDNTAPAARAKSIAEEFERMAQDLLEKASEDTNAQNPPQSAD